MPKSKVYRYEKGDLLYVDTYWTNGEYSGGKTLIYAKEVPVWMMDYDGWCKGDDKEVTAFLKQALLSAYSAGKFMAGRGPQFFYENGMNQKDLIYRNDYRGLGYQNQYDVYHMRFPYFQGREIIYRYPYCNITLFLHRYKGLTLFGNDGKKRTVSYLEAEAARRM